MTRSEVADVDTVSAAASQVMKDHSGNLDAASKALIAWVRRDRSLKQALLEPLVEYACYNAVRRCQISTRDKVWHPPQPREGASEAERIAVLAKSNLMMFALPIAGGKFLKDANREDVSQASDFYGKQADDMAHKARWLNLIGQSLTGKKTVGQALDEVRLRELQETARHG